MSDNYLGQISCFGFGYPPKGWMPCNGQLLPINQYQALFSLLGTTFGGDGRTNFGLPDLRSRVPIASGNDGLGNNYTLGQKGGEESHTLLNPEMPSHNHKLMAQAQPTATLTTNAPSSTVALSSGWFVPNGKAAARYNFYSASAPNAALSNGGGSTGGVPALALSGGQPHANLMPYLVVNFCIALVGIFPSRN